MTPREAQLLILLCEEPRNIGIGDMLDPDIRNLVDLEYAELHGQKLSITDEGRSALLDAQEAA